MKRFMTTALAIALGATVTFSSGCAEEDGGGDDGVDGGVDGGAFGLTQPYSYSETGACESVAGRPDRNSLGSFNFCMDDLFTFGEASFEAEAGGGVAFLDHPDCQATVVAGALACVPGANYQIEFVCGECTGTITVGSPM